MRDPLEGAGFDARRTLIGVLAVLAGLAAIGVVNPTALGVIGIWVGIILIIMIHEGGHYVTAKWSDMKVTEYFLGFGPRLWSFRRGETEYGVKAIPAGGYVRIVGMNNLEEVDPADEPRTYRSKPYRQRLMVVIAGVTTHFVMAFVLYLIILTVFGVNEAQPAIRELVDRSPAAQAGLEEGDRIVAIDGTPVEEWDDVTRIVRPRPGEQVTVVIERDGDRVQVPLTLGKENPDGERVGFLGIAPTIAAETRPVFTAAKDVVVGIGHDVGSVVKVLGGFFTPSHLRDYGSALTGEGDAGRDRFLSPVGATSVAAEAVDAGLPAVLEFLAGINIVVGTLNLLPLPPLDGGHVAVATYEKIASLIRRRRVQVDMAKIMPIALVVVFLFLFIGISSLWLDIFQPVDVGF
ncbi:MAG: site-2 protease family protein [Actinobacteria bacterium]|nr:site-2 protease family protein [Actinomycetota bacterium]